MILQLLFMQQNIVNTLKGLIAAAQFTKIGFEHAQKSTVSERVKMINPFGLTAFRDSLLLGSKTLIDLGRTLHQIEVGQIWNFVHIIITDGEDQKSTSSWEDVVRNMHAVGQLLDVQKLKIIIIDVGASSGCKFVMQLLSQVGGQNLQYYSIQNASADKILSRITVSLGLHRQRNIRLAGNQQGCVVAVEDTVVPGITIAKHTFAVLLNMDVSESMKGAKWGHVCKFVDNLMEYLGDQDLVSALVFNQQVRLLQRIHESDRLFNQQQQTRQNGRPQLQIENIRVVVPNPENSEDESSKNEISFEKNQKVKNNPKKKEQKVVGQEQNMKKKSEQNKARKIEFEQHERTQRNGRRCPQCCYM